MGIASTISTLRREYSCSHEEEVDLVLLLLNGFACFVDTTQTRCIAFDEADLAIGVDLTQLLDNLGCLPLIATDEVDA